MALLLVAYPLSFIIPAGWGWENALFENLQVMVLLVGLARGVLFYRKETGALAVLGLCAGLLWSVLAARELSWGAVFMPPVGMTGKGPEFSSSVLWYRSAVHPVLAVLAGLCMLLGARYRLDRLLMSVLRRGRFPWIELLLFVVAAIAATAAEGHVHLEMFDFIMAESQRQVLEELVELVGYAALVLAQWRFFAALNDEPRTR